MRFHTLILAAAPIALLGACSDGADDTDAATMTTEELDTTATATDPADEPGRATSLADAGDFSGDYTTTAPDGTTRSVRLNANDNTYSYTDAEGNEQTGTFTRDNDGYRLRITDFYGGPGIFTLRDGSLYRLNDDASVTADSMVQGERYTRSDGDGAPFSREPEPGSPVAPQDLNN